jgi:hypothetical protein
MKNVSTWAGLFLGVLILGAMVPSANAIAIDDVTFQILPEPEQFADAAVLISGNDDLTEINNLDGAYAGDPWVLLDKTDELATEFQGVTFEITADVGDPEGAWTLSWMETGEPGLPVLMDFVFVTKAATDWGAYLFESITFTSDPLTGEGTFTISWTNNGGSVPDLSSASVYGRIAEPEIPTPGTLLLMLLGLAALGSQSLLKRRRSLVSA